MKNRFQLTEEEAKIILAFEKILVEKLPHPLSFTPERKYKTHYTIGIITELLLKSARSFEVNKVT